MEKTKIIYNILADKRESSYPLFIKDIKNDINLELDIQDKPIATYFYDKGYSMGVLAALSFYKSLSEKELVEITTQLMADALRNIDTGE